MSEKSWKNGLKSEPVTAYVSEETKEAWKEHAENLNLTLSQFVELMVNAGRSMYKDTAPEGFEGSDLASARRRIDALEDRIDQLESHTEPGKVFEIYTSLGDGYRKLDDLAERVGEEEPEVYEALQLLMDENLVEYDPMRNAYRRSEDE